MHSNDNDMGSINRVRFRPTGFTLLELLAAMAIFAIVASLIYGSFSAVLYNADSLSTDGELIEMGSACLQRMQMDLEALHIALYPRYAPPDIDDEPDPYRFLGSEQMIGGQLFSQLRFTSLAHLPFSGIPGENIAEIVYYVQKTERDGYVIRRTDNTYPYPEFEEDELDPVMCENVLNYKLTYYDHENGDHKEWDSESDDTDHSTPVSVEIELVVGTQENNHTLKTEVWLPMRRLQPTKR